MMEAGVVLVGRPRGLEAVYWHVPRERTAGSLPDSRDLWDVLWECRGSLVGFAHSHPGSGVPGPSGTDLTTFAAVEAALGRRIAWWITSEDFLVLVYWDDATGGYGIAPSKREGDEWVYELRRRSGFSRHHQQVQGG